MKMVSACSRLIHRRRRCGTLSSAFIRFVQIFLFALLRAVWPVKESIFATLQYASSPLPQSFRTLRRERRLMA